MGSEKRKKEKKSDSKKKKHKHDRSDREERKSKRRHRDSYSGGEEGGEGSSNLEKASLSVSETNAVRAKLGLKPLQMDEPEPSKPAEEDKNVISLSVEETNKLREKLGLKPLDVGDKPCGDVHVPAKNMRQIVETQKLAEKMKVLKEKRRIKEQMSRVKSLGSSSSDLTDTMAWIQRNRDLATKKAAAEAQNKMLDSMDDEFGVGDLVSREEIRGKNYTPQDLKDLTVSHGVDSFKEGTITILTLQDRGVLDEEGDEGEVLENVNIADNERVAKSNENKKSKPGYNPYEDEFDDEGNPRTGKSMLSKYDEVIEGERKKTFKLSDVHSGEVIQRKMQEGLKPKNISLAMDNFVKTAQEYYTHDEVASFKKPRKRKRKIRKAKDLEADELVVMGAGGEGKDHGSRDSRRRAREEGGDVVKGEADGAGNMDIDIDDEQPEPLKKSNGKKGVVSEKELYSVPLEEEDNELEQALARSRRSKLMMAQKTAVMDQISRLPSQKEEEESLPGAAKSSLLVLDTTAEFAKGIGQTKDDDDDGEDMDEDIPQPESPDNMEETPQGDWKNVDFVTATFGEFQDYDPKRAEQQEVIEAEPSLQRGLMGALQVAQRKGFLEVEKGVNSRDVKEAIKATGSIKARFYQVDNDRDDKDQGGSGGRRGRDRRDDDRPMGGSYSSFTEKKGYNPDVRIVYTDNLGRELDSKEAFRQLSHKFHGKGSGKMKTEKRLKKALEQMALKKMDSEDTPLGSAALLREKQKDANAAYVVLSGGNRLPQVDQNAKLSKR
eukprot:sb/3462284/